MPSSLFDLTGKVALVTGASRGIGLAVAREMGLAGARVVVTSNDDCESAARGLREDGIEALAIGADIGRDEDLDHLVAQTLAACGRIDILVSNAGINQTFGAMAEIDPDEYETVMRINLRSAVELCRRVVPHMQAQKSGAIILMSSLSGLRGNAKIGTYALSKAALAQLARNLAVELGPDNIRVNAISPGLIRTDFSASMMANPDILDKRLLKTPLRRVGEAREIAGTAVYLASDAGAFTTGHNLVVDGGTLISD